VNEGIRRSAAVEAMIFFSATPVVPVSPMEGDRAIRLTGYQTARKRPAGLALTESLSLHRTLVGKIVPVP